MLPAGLPLAFALISMEGPDEYSQAGGLGVRVAQLARALAAMGEETHVFFVGDPGLPARDRSQGVHWQRLAQGISGEYPAGVYSGEELKWTFLQARFPSWLVGEWVARRLDEGKLPVLMFEDWQTAGWAQSCASLLERSGWRRRCLLVWNANNQFGFQRMDWVGLADSCAVTTVSKYMRLLVQRQGVDPVVIPNGIPEQSLRPPDAEAVEGLRAAAAPKQVLLKVGRFHPDKRWLQAVGAVALLRTAGRPVRMLVRGAGEAYGERVRAEVVRLGLRLEVWPDPVPSWHELARALASTPEVDVLELARFLPEALLPPMYAASLAVLANSGFEPFGLVGLEAMAAGGVAVVGATGEDYARHLYNALVIETGDAAELAAAVGALESDPARTGRLRQAAAYVASTYTWPTVINGDLLPRLPLVARLQRVDWPGSELAS